MKEHTTQRARVPLLLPVRTKLAPWQTIKTWFHQLWQRWQTPRLRVQPPLQPGRHKPFPQRPHQQRRQAVFAALDAAPIEFTRRQLIAHVRAVTGLGCSEKLITQWRRERKGEGATRGQGDAQTRAKRPPERGWRGVQLRLFLVCLLLGATLKPWHPVASVAAQEITISPAPSVSPTIASPPGPRLLRIKLTLHNPRELRIKAGDEVKAGDILSEQRQARQRLLIQKRTLETVVRHLHTQQQLTAESLQQLHALGLDLPPITFATEQAAIQRAEAEAIAVQRAVEIQRERVSSFESIVSRETDALISRNSKLETRNLIQAHETAKLTQAQDKQWLAHSEIELHKAKLTTAQETRVWEEQKHRVEITRQRLSVRQQQQQAAIEFSRLTAQIAELDLQLAQLTAIRAPFTGTIKRIEWEDMNDEKITVLVYLSLGSR